MKVPGAIYYNGFFPGFIGVPPNSAFTVLTEGTEVMLHIVRHPSPVVVTDFGNDFLPFEKEGRHFTMLKRPIDSAPTNTIGATFRAVDGIEPREFFCTKEHYYALYRKQTFTEITVGAETEDAQDPNSVSAAIFNQAIDEFLQLYRIVTRDAWVLRPDRLQKNVPIIRTAAVAYNRMPSTTTRQERLVSHIPQHFQPIIFSVQEYAQDTPALRHDPADTAARLGHHLAVGTKLSDAQRALLDCFEALMNSKNFRFALVESFSIAEVISFDYFEKIRRNDPSVNDLIPPKRGGATMNNLIQFVFPKVFAQTLQQFPDFLQDLDITRKMRNATLHGGQTIQAADAERALNSVQRLIFAIETPDWAF